MPALSMDKKLSWMAANICGNVPTMKLRCHACNHTYEILHEIIVGEEGEMKMTNAHPRIAI
jgi:predicted nucleic acid-binding Zn ribbon protein